MKIKKNDTVLVLTGKDAGKTGKVIGSIPADNKVKVDGVNVQKKSKKARSANETSAIVNQVGAIDASNVMVICPSCNKATRVSYKIADGKKIRICKKCGASLDVAVAKKAAPAKKTSAKKADGDDVKAEKKTTAKKTAAKKTADGAEKKTTAKKNTKKATETADKAE